mmetsp:Transcript_11931/g.28301  ORF Transcript_11931/g.28301 Transcript_11931/m.28301 type:complete len:582 (-) Transcript_11931:140-1885(-)
MTSSSERYRHQLRQRDETIVTRLPGNPLLSETTMDRKNGRNRTTSRNCDDGYTPWASYGEREKSRSVIVGSPRLPRRKGSFDGDEALQRTRTSVPPPPPTSPPRTSRVATTSRTRTALLEDELSPFYSQVNDEITVNKVLSSSRRKGRGPLNRVKRFSSPISFEHESETNRPGWGSNDLLDERPVGLFKAPRRASTGTRDYLDSSLAGVSRGETLGDTRPCMDASTHSAPITRRRTSLNGSRPCMDGYADEVPTFDRPALRPYRQLSSEDLCIGEETEEDLSNRSMLRTTDASNRSNRSSFNVNSDDRSIRSMRQSADASNRSNRSAFTNDFSNRSYRTMDDISIRTFRTLDDFSQRSYRTNMDEMNNRSTHSLLSNHSLHLSNHSLRMDVSNRSMRSTHIPQVVSEGNEDDSTVGPQPPSPLNETEDFSFRTAKDEESYRTACTTQPQEPEEESQRIENENKPCKNQPLNCKPEPWPVNDEEPMKPSTVREHQRRRPAVTKSKTWPNNLMILLSIKRMGLKKSLSFVDGNSSTTTKTSICSFDESDDSFSNKDVLAYELDPAIDRSTSSRQRTVAKSTSA